MSSVEEHYENLLARHYSWMRGDYDSMVRECLAFFEEAGVAPRSGGKALDLGCGPGFQSIALAELGFAVLSVDTSGVLLEELRSRAGGRDILAVPGDIRDPGVYAAEGPFEVAVCIGDTLTHLATPREGERGKLGVARWPWPLAAIETPGWLYSCGRRSRCRGGHGAPPMLMLVW